MRKTLFGMAGVAALVFSFNVGASDVRAGDAARGPMVHRARASTTDEARSGSYAEVQDDSRRSAIAMVHRARASTTDEERSGPYAEAMKPCDASEGAGSASGEPSAGAKSSSSNEEFLHSIWTAP